MTFMIVARLCATLTLLCTFAWCFRIFASGYGWHVPPIVSSVFFNLRPFYFPALAVYTVYLIRIGDLDGIVDYLLNAISWVGGYWMRNDKDDEDRWKRRREKVAAKVQEAGGKLVVVPVGSNA